MRWRPRVSTTSVDDADATRLEPSRFRLQGRVGLFDRVHARLQLDYDAGEWGVDDAWVMLRVARETEVTVGQAKRPFTVLSMRSGSRVGPVSRGGSLRGAEVREEQNLVGDAGFGDRGIGLQVATPLPGAPGVRLEAGVFPADPRDRPFSLDDAQVGARLSAEVAREVRVGAAWSRRTGPSAGDDGPGAGTALALDVEAGRDDPGAHLLAEVVTGRTDTFDGARFHAAQAWLLYRTGEMGRPRVTFEPLVRLSAAGGALRDEHGPGLLATAGLNLYVGDPDDWNRLMVNVDHWTPRGGAPRAHSLKVQLQIGP